MKKEERTCESCLYYSAFTEPRKLPDGICIYGYCFVEEKYAKYSGCCSGYPMIVSDGHVCRDYRTKKGETNYEYKT